jgi:UDP-N-acetylglucosamine--N-acetylmuramyl-(pentapeptide) pyrophosphoryl-undecaprenol N-acetylglucosamine transferase
MKVIIAAAGTGGHINPGIAIANTIKQKEPDSEIIFIGTSRGLENDLVPRAGYELKQIDAYGFDRHINLENIKKICKTINSLKEAKKIIKEFNPDVVIGTGGYITAVVGYSAKKCKKKLIIHESNAFPGMAVKMLEKKADKILVGFEDAKDRLKKANNVLVTGTPTKIKNTNLSDIEKQQILQRLGFKNNLPYVLVFGGSQGAKSINESLLNIIENNKNTNYNLIWATGSGAYDEIQQELEDKNINRGMLENTKVIPYIYNMEEILNSVDLVVSRSGAMTITEISNVGKPAIFIPFPFATENHQEYNAKVLEKIGSAKIILDKDLTADNLHNQIEKIINNPQLMREMGINARKNSIENAEEKIYKEIKKCV